jgi:hypothetical protein
LLDLANRGTPAGIVDWLNRIEQVNRSYIPFTTQIRQFVKRFQLDEICQFLETQIKKLEQC